jgi:hypothetical protein
MVARIDSLTDAQRERMDSWADEWIEIGLRTGPADRPAFESAARRCYKHAGIPWPDRVVWVSSPLVMAIAAPVSALIIHMTKRDAVSGAVRGAVRGAVDDAVDDAVDGAVDDAVRDAVRGAVGGAVDGAVRGAVDIRKAVSGCVLHGWRNYIGGQLWAGGWWWGGAYTSFFREVCGLELEPDLWARGVAYEETIKSACWWYPHRDFVMVCERPTGIYRELANPDHPRGWGSHRLHCETGPAIAWPDGWGVYAVHGVRVPARIIERPESITHGEITSEKNAEIRRVMMERYGLDRYLADCGAKPIHADEYGELYRMPGMTLPLVRVVNSTPEPDGTSNIYVLTAAREDCRTAHDAVASTFGLTADQYQPAVET